MLFHGPGKLRLPDFHQVAFNILGALAYLRRHALEGHRYVVAFYFGLDAKFLKAFKLPGRRIGYCFDHLIDVLAHGAGSVAIGHERPLGRIKAHGLELDEGLNGLFQAKRRLRREVLQSAPGFGCRFQ